MSDQILDLLAAVQPPPQFGEVIEARYIDRDGDVKRRFYDTGQDLASDALTMAPYRNIYYGVTLRKGGGDAQYCTRAGSFYADVDGKLWGNGPDATQAARAACDGFDLPPSALVNSAHGWHAYWALTVPVDLHAEGDSFRAINAALARAVCGPDRSPDNVSDVARVLRLPGTLNHKDQPPRTVVLESLYPDRRYALADVRAFLEEQQNWALQPQALSPADRPTDGDFARLLAEGSPNGSRNTDAARLAGHLIGKGLDPQEVRVILTAWAARCDPPLPLDELHRVVESINRADARKRSRAVTDAPHFTPLASVTPERVKWLWPARLPAGKVTVLDGDPGLGKSQITLDLVARLTTGRPLPDGARGDIAGPLNVLLLSAEDDPGDTIRPRLDAAGADVNRVDALTHLGQDHRLPTIPDDLPVIRERVESWGVGLIVIDPLMAYLATGSKGTDAHKDQDIRRALGPLALLAQETGAAVLVVRHLNKAGGGGNPLYRGGGSIGIIGAARCGLLVASDPAGGTTRRVLAVTKSNLATLAPSLTYRVESADNGSSHITWGGTCPLTAAQLLADAATVSGHGPRQEAAAFLTELLKDGPRPADDVKAEAQQAGLNWATVRRAKDQIGVIVFKSGFGKDGRWLWAYVPLIIKTADDDEEVDSG